MTAFILRHLPWERLLEREEMAPRETGEPRRKEEAEHFHPSQTIRLASNVRQLCVVSKSQNSVIRGTETLAETLTEKAFLF